MISACGTSVYSYFAPHNEPFLHGALFFALKGVSEKAKVSMRGCVCDKISGHLLLPLAMPSSGPP
jgi:hypothetical protein